MAHPPVPIHQVCEVVTRTVNLEGEFPVVDLFLEERRDVGNYSGFGKERGGYILELRQESECLSCITKQGLVIPIVPGEPPVEFPIRLGQLTVVTRASDSLRGSAAAVLAGRTLCGVPRTISVVQEAWFRLHGAPPVKSN